MKDDKHYQDCVNECRKLLSEIESKKHLIAKIALKLCTVQVGGGKHAYNLKTFSDDIGVNHSCLKEWVKVYRDVCMPLGIDKPTKGEWAKARKTRKKLLVKGQRKNEFNPDKVKEAYKEVVAGTSLFSSSKNYGQETFDVIFKDLRRIYQATQKLDLSTQDQTTLKNSAELCNRIGYILSSHLTKKTKYKVG